MHSGDQWERLLSALRAAHGPVVAEGGSIRLTEPRVELVITPRDWDGVVGIPFGSVEPAIEHVLRVVEGLEPGTPFLVHHQYDLHPSRTRELPPDPGLERLRAWRAEHPGEFLTIRAYPAGDPRNDRGGGPQNGPPPTQ